MLVCCDAIGHACEACSTWLTKTCTWLCPTDRPSPIFTVFSICINLAIVIVSIVLLAGDASRDCSTGSKCKAWYGVSIPIAIVNAIFAFYIYWRFMQELKKGRSACKTMSKFLLYDVGCYLYIWVYIFQIIWLALGPSSSMCGGESVCTGISNTAAIVALFATYVGGGVFMFLVSVTVQCCYEDPRATNNNNNSNDNGAAAPFPVSMGTAIAYTAVTGNNSGSRNVYQNSNNNNNNNNNSTAVVAGAVASLGKGMLNLAGTGLAKLGNVMTSGSNSNNNNYNNNSNSGGLAPAPPPPQPQHYSAPLYAAPPPPAAAAAPQYGSNSTVYNQDNKTAGAQPQW